MLSCAGMTNARPITLRIARTADEAARLEREFWAALPPEERVLEAWRLTLELWALKGWDPDEPGLRRVASRADRR